MDRIPNTVIRQRESLNSLQSDGQEGIPEHSTTTRQYMLQVHSNKLNLGFFFSLHSTFFP